MRLLLDQDVYALTARFLRREGHDVLTAAELGMAQATDETLLRRAAAEGRIFVTRDRDIGGLVFLRDISTGVLYLRIRSSTLNTVHAELSRILQQHDEQTLRKAFVVITPDGHRLRHINRLKGKES